MGKGGAGGLEEEMELEEESWGKRGSAGLGGGGIGGLEEELEWEEEGLGVERGSAGSGRWSRCILGDVGSGEGWV